MTNETEQKQSSAARMIRRVAASTFIGLMFFVLLWIVVFDAVTAAVLAGGLALISFTAGSVFDAVGVVLEAIAAAFAAVVGAIAGIFSIFG